MTYNDKKDKYTIYSGSMIKKTQNNPFLAIDKYRLSAIFNNIAQWSRKTMPSLFRETIILYYYRLFALNNLKLTVYINLKN